MTGKKCVNNHKKFKYRLCIIKLRTISSVMERDREERDERERRERRWGSSVPKEERTYQARTDVFDSYTEASFKEMHV